MVSGKSRFGLSTVLLSVMVSGCVAQMPVKFRAEGDGNNQEQQAGMTGADRQQPGSSPAMYADAGGSVPRQLSPSEDVTTMKNQAEDAGEDIPQQLSLSANTAPIPRQAYDAGGIKIPYVPQPNPYTSGNAAVPTEARAMFVTASARLKEGNLSSAQSKFEQLAEKYPDLSGPWVKLGEIAERREQYDDAIGHYRRAIKLNRNNVNAYIALGMVQRRQGRFNDAQQAYLAALDVWKDFPEAHLNLAILYDLYGNQAEAAQRHYEAYYFLTGGKDEKAHKWLVEVRQRTGIEQSLIDFPPAVAEAAPAGEGESNSVAVARENP
jgi:tetratricopeptide (TPR) repeat protein